jgi:hypothetical protein
MKKLSRLRLVLLRCSPGRLLAFRLIASHVDRKGVLGEPFFQLPIRVLLAGAGVAPGSRASIGRQAPDRR